VPAAQPPEQGVPRMNIIAVLIKIGLVGQGCTRHRNRRRVCHPFACSASLCASDRLTRRRGGAESARRSCKVCQTGLHPSLETSASRATSRRRRGGHGMPCPHTRRWKWAPRATRQTRTRVNVFENCYSITEYLFKVHKPSALRGEARLRGRERIISSTTIRPPEARED